MWCTHLPLLCCLQGSKWQIVKLFLGICWICVGRWNYDFLEVLTNYSVKVTFKCCLNDLILFCWWAELCIIDRCLYNVTVFFLYRHWFILFCRMCSLRSSLRLLQRSECNFSRCGGQGAALPPLLQHRYSQHRYIYINTYKNGLLLFLSSSQQVLQFVHDLKSQMP